MPRGDSDERPWKNRLKTYFSLALHFLSNEEGYPGEDGQEKEAKRSGRCAGILSTAFFERGDQEDRSSQEYRSAYEIGFPDGSHPELWTGMFGFAHEGKLCGMRRR